MNFHTFGDKENEAIVFIHGALTPWQIFEDAADHFSKDHYVVIPELDAHTEDAPTVFTTLEKEAELIRDYIVDNLGGKVYALCGLSMGGRIAAILAAMPEISVKYLVLDGAPLARMNDFLVGIMKKNYIKIINDTKQRDPKVIENCKKNFLPDRYLEDFLKVAYNMGEESISNFLDSVFAEFAIPKYPDDMKILFMHGSKRNEGLAARAALKLKEVNPQTEIRRMEGYFHAQLCCYEIDKWINEVDGFIRK